MINKRNRRGWVAKKGKRKAGPRIRKIPDSTRLTRMIRLTRLTRMAGTPSIARETRHPRTIRRTSLTRRDRLTRTASLDRPTRMNRLDRPAKMPRLNRPAGYTINETAADGRRRQKTERVSQISVTFRILLVIFPILPFRGVPWGSGRRSGWVAINTNQHPTRKCEKKTKPPRMGDADRKPKG